MKNYALFTNDVESTSIWFNTLSDKTGEKVLNEGMPILLDLYEKYNVKSTFFFTWYIAKKFPDLVKMILPYGHEVASHGKSHLVKNGFDVMPFEKQVAHLKDSKILLEDLSGQEVISFRAPALRVNKITATALIETGFKIDSSVASQRFDFFFSVGGINKLKWLYSPRNVYSVATGNIFRKGNSGLIEIPLSAIIFPYLGTTMRIFPKFSNLVREMIHFESSHTRKPIVFDIHPNEFIDESSEKRTIDKRSKSFINSLIQDTLRSTLKSKNLGPKAVPLFEKELQYFVSKKYCFSTLKDYCLNERLF